MFHRKHTLPPALGAAVVVVAVAVAAAVWSAAGADPATAAPAGSVFEVPVAGIAGVPADAAGVVLNVTATNTTADGYFTAFPCGQTRPTASNVNYRGADSVANLAVAALGAGGRVCVYTSAGADVIVDLAGWFDPGAGIHTVRPVRVADTRTAHSLAGAGSATPFDLSGVIPPGAVGAIVNVTATNPTADGYLTVFPCGEPIPATSNLNYTARRTVPGVVFAGFGLGTAVCLSSYVPVDVVIDVAGWLDAGTFTPVRPTRLADTRTGSGPVTAAVPLEVAVPPGAGAVVNVTATNPAADGYLTVFPCGQTPPVVSNVNYLAGQTVANLAVAAAPGGRVCVTSYAPADVIVDLVGTLPPAASGYHPVGPLRIFDSRTVPGPGAVTAGQLLSAPVPSLCGHPAGTLVNGALPGIPPGEGIVTLLFDAAGNLDSDLVAFGDLTGDGIGDAAAVLYCNRGGVSWPETIQIYGPGPALVGSIALSDHVRDDLARAGVLRLWYDNSAVRFQWHTTRDGDAACCGTLDASARARVVGGTVAVDEVVVYDENPALTQLFAAVNAGDRPAALAVADPAIADTLIALTNSYGDFGTWSCEGVLTDGGPSTLAGDRLCSVALPGGPPVFVGMTWTGFASWRAVDVHTGD